MPDRSLPNGGSLAGSLAETLTMAVAELIEAEPTARTGAEPGEPLLRFAELLALVWPGVEGGPDLVGAARCRHIGPD